MAVLDWVLLAVLGLSMLVGAWRGLVFELLSLVGWVAAFFLAQWFAPAVAPLLPMGQAADAVRYGAAFALVLIAGVFAAGLLARIVKKLVEAIGLRPADRALGALFGVVRGLVVLLAATVLVQLASLQTAVWWQESRGAGILDAALRGLKPALPEAFVGYLP